jgi:hypothetical protein
MRQSIQNVCRLDGWVVHKHVPISKFIWHREKENYSQIQLAHHRGIYTAYSTILLNSE